MKKNLFFLAAAAVALASCSSDDTIAENSKVTNNQPQEIAFFALNQNATRGAVTTAAFPTTENIKASALDLTNHHQFFAPTSFTRNGSTGLWEGDTKRYWPLSEVQVNFLAIALENVADAGDVTWTTTGTQSSEEQSVAVVQADNYAVAKQKDFMYAIGNGQVTRNGNNLSFPTKVDMTFKHAQAYLVFNAKAADAATATNLKIKNILINGARTSGTATIARTNAGTYADGNINLNWTSTDYPGGGTASAYNSVTPTQADFSPLQTISSSDYTEIGNLMVVPNMSAVNTFADGGFTSIKIVYTIDSQDYEYIYTPAAANTNLKAGYKYVYNITFKLHEIVIDPVVTVWDTDIDGDTNADDDVNILIPSVAYNESGATVSIGHTAATYTFDISGVPAAGGSSYAIVEGSSGTDFVDTVNMTDNGDGSITVTVKSIGGDDNATRDLKLKLGEIEKMTITLKLSNTALDS